MRPPRARWTAAARGGLAPLLPALLLALSCTGLPPSESLDRLTLAAENREGKLLLRVAGPAPARLRAGEFFLAFLDGAGQVREAARAADSRPAGDAVLLDVAAARAAAGLSPKPPAGRVFVQLYEDGILTAVSPEAELGAK